MMRVRLSAVAYEVHTMRGPRVNRAACEGGKKEISKLLVRGGGGHRLSRTKSGSCQADSQGRERGRSETLR